MEDLKTKTQSPTKDNSLLFQRKNTGSEEIQNFKIERISVDTSEATLENLTNSGWTVMQAVTTFSSNYSEIIVCLVKFKED